MNNNETKQEPKTLSWWLNPRYQARLEPIPEEVLARQRRENKHAFWDTKVVGMQNGKI